MRFALFLQRINCRGLDFTCFTRKGIVWLGCLQLHMKRVLPLFVSLLLLVGCGSKTQHNAEPAPVDSVPSDTSAVVAALPRLAEAYGLTYDQFLRHDDVEILNADTSAISVSKALAQKLGIVTFVNHPLAVWQNPGQLPYHRRCTSEQLEGDRYVLTLQPVTLSEVLGDRQVQFSTLLYIKGQGSSHRASATADLSTQYADDEGVVHPAMIYMTDPLGYDEDYHADDAVPVKRTSGRRAASSASCAFVTPEELLAGGRRRASATNRILHAETEVKYSRRIQCGPSTADTLYVSFKSPIFFDVNYFITLDTQVRWFLFVPQPYVQRLETGLKGTFSLDSHFRIGFEGKRELPEDKQHITLARFPSYTFVFMAGTIPIAVTTKPSLDMTLSASVEGSFFGGFDYEYASDFKVGCAYRYGRGWNTIAQYDKTRDDFDFCYPEADFHAESKAQVSLGVDVSILGVGGPRAFVGPTIATDARLKVASQATQPVDFQAKVTADVQARAGAKVKLLGYSMTERDTTFTVVPEWTLWQLPAE